METLTELIVRIAELVEAEGRVLRAMVVHAATAISLIVIASASIIAGLVLVLGSIYLFISELAGSAASAAVVGMLALAAGGGLAWLGRRMGT